MTSQPLKLVVLGAGGVGKSAICIQFVQGFFVEDYDPTIEDTYRRHVDYEEETYTLEILDTAGTELYGGMKDLYITHGHGFMLVYSITAKSTLYALNDIHEQILRIKEDNAKIPMVVVGNKCDLANQRLISQEEGKEFAETCGGTCAFLEASAKTRTNLVEAFYELIAQVLAQMPKKEEEHHHRSRLKLWKRCVIQ